MKSNLFAFALVAAVAGSATSAFARDELERAAPQVVSLKDGALLYIFKDGKMARENKFGQPWLFKKGEVLETADGRKLTPVGNEVARLDGLFKNGHGN